MLVHHSVVSAAVSFHNRSEPRLHHRLDKNLPQYFMTSAARKNHPPFPACASGEIIADIESTQQNFYRVFRYSILPRARCRAPLGYQ